MTVSASSNLPAGSSGEPHVVNANNNTLSTPNGSKTSINTMVRTDSKPESINEGGKWRAKITDIEWRGLQVLYRIETRVTEESETRGEEEDGEVCAVVNRSYWECARTHRVLGRFYEEATGSRLSFPSMAVGFMASVASGKHIEHQRFQLQTWLDNVLSVSTPQCHSAVWRLLGYPTSRQETTDTPLANIPLIDHVTGFLDHPKDIAALCAVNTATWNTMRPHLDAAWRICLQRRWPGIHDALATNLENLDWRQAWRQILSGGEILMGVHERQLKRGFAMSCMPAWISWDKMHKSFRVVYLSGLTMTPTEYIGADCFDRLAKMRGDPYAAFESDAMEDFQPGDSCAVQWKMLRNGPFGWWYGTIHQVFKMNGQWHADVRFTHIVNDSRWHQLLIPIGSALPTEAQSGGFTGGIIKVPPQESQVWNKFWPARPMCLS